MIFFNLWDKRKLHSPKYKYKKIFKYMTKNYIVLIVMQLISLFFLYKALEISVFKEKYSGFFYDG